MDFLIKSKILYIIIGILIILNILSVGSLWLWRSKSGHKPPHITESHMKRDGKTFLMKELNLTKAQSDETEKLRGEHFKKINPILEDIHKLKDELFAQLPLKDSSKLLEIANKIGAKHSELELETVRHFQKIRELLDDAQKSKFDVILKDIIKPEKPFPFHRGLPGEHPDTPPLRRPRI